VFGAGEEGEAWPQAIVLSESLLGDGDVLPLSFGLFPSLRFSLLWRARNDFSFF